MALRASIEKTSKCPRSSSISIIAGAKRLKNFYTIESAEDQTQRVSIIDGFIEFKTSGWTCVNNPSGMIPVSDTISKKTGDECLVPKAQPPVARTPVKSTYVFTDLKPKARVEIRESQPQLQSHTHQASSMLPVHERLQKIESKELDIFYFSKAEEKVIIKWMVKYTAIRVVGHSEEFGELLTQLGFNSSLIRDADKDRLRRRTSQKLQSIERPLKKAGAILNINKTGRGKFEVEFQEWAQAWLEDDWDGQLVKPVSYRATNRGGYDEEEREIFVVEEQDVNGSWR